MEPQPDLTPLLTRRACPTADGDGFPCGETPTMACPKCLMVEYCSDKCLVAHRVQHKEVCDDFANASDENFWQNASKPVKTMEAEFWGKYPATDILNLEKNEGRFYDGDLHLLLTGDNPLRHILYTLTKVPETARSKLYITAVETSMHRIARMILVLQLLCDETQDPMVNAETALHLWYSTHMPTAMWKHLTRVVALPFLVYIRDILDDYNRGLISKDSDYALDMDVGPIKFTIELRAESWRELADVLHLTNRLEAEEIKHARVMDQRLYCQLPTAEHVRMTPARTTAMLRWRRQGVLTPCSQPTFTPMVLNPLYFQKHQLFPAGCTAEPLTEWPMAEILKHDSGYARNDIYGKMFYYVRGLLVKASKAIKFFVPEFAIGDRLIENLPDLYIHYPLPTHTFDRIEVGLNFDRKPFVTLVMMSILLRSHEENPHARLLTMTRESVTHSLPTVENDLNREKDLLYQEAGCVLDKYAPPIKQDEKPESRNAVRRRMGLVFWRNWDRFSERQLSSPEYMPWLKFVKLSKHGGGGISANGVLGLRKQAKNIITRPWPTRLVHSAQQALSEEDFNNALGWGDNRPERWLEWKKMEEVPMVVFDKWLDMIMARHFSASTALQKEAICSEGSKIEKFAAEYEGSDSSVTLSDPGSPPPSYEEVMKQDLIKAYNDANDAAKDAAKRLIEEEAKEEAQAKAEAEKQSNRGKKESSKKKKNKKKKGRK